MSEVTSDIRFPGQLNCDFRKFVVNLISFLDERSDVGHLISRSVEL